MLKFKPSLVQVPGKMLVVNIEFISEVKTTPTGSPKEDQFEVELENTYFLKA